MVTGTSSRVYWLLKLCLKQVHQVSAVTLHDHRQPNVLEVIDGSVNHRETICFISSLMAFLSC